MEAVYVRNELSRILLTVRAIGFLIFINKKRNLFVIEKNKY